MPQTPLAARAPGARVPTLILPLLRHCSVASCLGSMIKDGVLLVEHLCLKKYETAN